ncbi:UBX domain-containing protein 10 [Bufo gargarizans]|uniref:UBX domain-containing protein 10 n=1 Tax=Bufo gargarizans TaxID=30331 RepID=UPI001CF3BC2E|nr:UBX domain-containing protein 10 [Bufo gargarizans]XP_044134542.1 UBX domain-containing protein 10 [Bufo gargarizans]
MASAPTGLNSLATGDPLQRMHVTRPKSAKGRTRTTLQGTTHNMEAYPCRTSPTPRVSSARALPGPRMAQDEISEPLHQLPYRPPSSSLNRYRVLPSIGTVGGPENVGDQLVYKTSAMRLTPEVHDRHNTKTLFREQNKPHQMSNHQGQVNMEDSQAKGQEPPSEQEPRLLLAIRSHSGQRFEQFFRPSDTLFTILVAAEEKTGVSCKDCSVESMEIPRRSFTDLSQTLQECRIPNKSVVCIHRLGRN